MVRPRMMRGMSEDNLLVLVADDEPSMREMVADHLRQLESPKLDVIVAENGEQALSIARERLPDLVVLDVMMPEMSGWEVGKRIREDISLAHTAVLMLTGIGEKVNELTSPLYGADAHIDKPFEFEDLDVKVRETLAARSSQRGEIPHTNGTTGVAAAITDMSGPGPAKAKAKAKAKPAKKKAGAPKKKAAAKAAPKKKAAKKKPAKKTAAKKKSAPKKKAAKKKPAKKKGRR
jgi:DNA-binding response OmpR family regulator